MLPPCSVCPAMRFHANAVSMQRAFNGSDCDCEALKTVRHDCHTLNADTDVGVVGKLACSCDAVLGSSCEEPDKLVHRLELEHKLVPEHRLVHRLVPVRKRVLEHKQQLEPERKQEPEHILPEPERKRVPVLGNKQEPELELGSTQVLELEQDSK